MALGFHSRPSHIAQNIIAGLDFDGTVSYSFHLRVAYAKMEWGFNLPISDVLSETWKKKGLDMDKYWQMADAVDNAMIREHLLAPGCREVLTYLHSQGFRFAVVSKRGPRLHANVKVGAVSPDAAPAWFVRHQGLPISYYHATDHSSGLKLELCNKLHARAFLDDDLKILEGLRGTFVKPFFIRQPWNVDQQTPPSSSGIVTVTNWNEFGRWLLYLKQMHEAICYFNRWENAYYNLQKIADFWRSHTDECKKYLENYKREPVRV